MKKRLYVYLGVVAFTVILVILSAIYESTYRVYLLPEVSGAFAAGADTADAFGTHEAKNPAQAAQEITFGEQSVALVYNEKLSNEMYAYTSADGTINCWYDTHSGKIRLLSAEGWFALPEGSELTKDNCLKWVYDQVEPHYTENWEQYSLHCETIVFSLEGGAPQQLQRDGFLTGTETETVLAYTFTFTKMNGQLETTDIIQAYIHPDNGFAAIEFCAHKFDNCPNTNVDTARLARNVKHFIRTSLNKGYTYLRHSLSQPTLTYINGKLCCVCTAVIVAQCDGKEQTITQQFAVTLE